MQKRVIVLTPSIGFGELIRQVLDDTGDYEAHPFARFQGARELAQKAAVALFVLDAEMTAEITPERMVELRRHAPHAKLIIIPVEEQPNDPALAAYAPDTKLPSPFYLPDLITAVEQFFGPIMTKEAVKRTSFGDSAPDLTKPAREMTVAPRWLEDVTLSARYLTQLSLESASQAALITRGTQVWAYAGELPGEAAEELAAAVAVHSANGNNDDLARFIHLEATKSDYMLYATPLGGEHTLALVFDAHMPFSQMRAQVSQLAKALSTAQLQELPKAAQAGLATEAAQTATAPRLQERESEGDAAQPPMPARSETNSAAQPAAGAGPTATALAELAAEGLRFGYVLLPRLPKHQLTGDLAERLAIWLPELCLAFAWRLDSFKIEPDYLQWTLALQPAESPEGAARMLDQHLSARVFEEFPRIAKDNPSGHFWAPGFLVLAGAAPTSAQVSDHIRQTRARQGVK